MEKKRFDLSKDQHNGFCLKVVTYCIQVLTPSRLDLTSELVCLGVTVLG